MDHYLKILLAIELADCFEDLMNEDFDVVIHFKPVDRLDTRAP